MRPLAFAGPDRAADGVGAVVAPPQAATTVVAPISFRNVRRSSSGVIASLPRALGPGDCRPLRSAGDGPADATRAGRRGSPPQPPGEARPGRPPVPPPRAGAR